MSYRSRKRILSAALSMALIVSLLPMGGIRGAEAAESGAPEASADAEGSQEVTASGTFGGEKDSEGMTVTEDTHQWSFAAGTGVLTISGEGAIPDYTSSSYTGLPWYQYASDIKKIVFTGNVTKVGAYLFYGYAKVEEADFSTAEKLTEIGENSFRGTTLLETLTGTDRVVALGTNCFYSSGLKTVAMPQVEAVPEAAFRACKSLKAIHFQGATVFGKQAFYQCTALTEVDAPKVETLGESVFNGCTVLGAIELPELLSITGGSAFYGCTKLQSISFPKLGTMNGSNVFVNCTSLETIDLPSVTSLTAAASFAKGCTSLTSVSIPNAAFTDASQIFYGCSSLVYVDISSAKTLSNTTIFSSCSSLKRIYLKGTELTSNLAAAFYNTLTTNPVIYHLSSATRIGTYSNLQPVDTEDEFAALKAKETTLHLTQENYDIDSDSPAEPKVTGNAPGAAVTYAYYTDVACANPVNSDNPSSKPAVAGDYYVRATAAATDSTFETTSNPAAFTIYGEIPGAGFTYHNSKNILTITDASVMDTEYSSYSSVPWYKYRTGVKEIIVKEGVTLTKIAPYAFYNETSMESFTLPDTVTEIGKYAFYGCKKWEAENVLTDRVASLGIYAFQGCSLISGTMTFGSAITEIPDLVLYGCSSVTKIVYSDDVTSFGDRCFAYTGVTEQYPLPSGMTEYPASFYAYCTEITNFVIPEGMTKLPNRLFQGCTGLTEIDIPDSVTEIGEYCFSSTGLTSMVLPENIQTLGKGVYNSTKIETLEIPETLTTLPESMISYSSLKKAIIPETVTMINKDVFRGCAQLEYLEFENDDYTADTFVVTTSSSGGVTYDNTFGGVPQTAMIVCDGATYEFLESRGTYRPDSLNGWLAEEILYQRSALLSGLEDAFKAAKEEAGRLEETDYDPELWSAFQAALADAEALISQGDTTYDRIQNMTAATKGIPAAAKAFLRATYQKTAGILEIDYDTDGDGADAWFVYLDELDEAMDVLQDADATLAQVIEADNDLRQAMEGIVLLPADGAKADFEKYLLQEAGALKEADYTAESWKALQDAIGEAEKLSQAATKISEVEAARKKVEDAVAALVKADAASTGTPPSTPPSTEPSTSPSVKPSASPSVKPSASPSVKPSASPSVKPSQNPGVQPSQNPGVQSSQNPGGATTPAKVSVKKVAIKKVSSKKKKTILVQWKKAAGVTGYQIQVGTNKKVTKGRKSYTVKKAKTVKKTIKKLKRKKTYYVRVRAYKTSGGKKHYGKWSSVKKVKVK